MKGIYYDSCMAFCLLLEELGILEKKQINVSKMESVTLVSTPHREIVNEKLCIICKQVGKKKPIQTDSGCKRIREKSLGR